jgi:hypothetical protein
VHFPSAPFGQLPGHVFIVLILPSSSSARAKAAKSKSDNENATIDAIDKIDDKHLFMQKTPRRERKKPSPRTSVDQKANAEQGYADEYKDQVPWEIPRPFRLDSQKVLGQSKVL